MLRIDVGEAGRGEIPVEDFGPCYSVRHFQRRIIRESPHRSFQDSPHP